MNPREKAANKEAFRQMTPAAKLEYIRTYYWGPILLAAAAFIILVTSLYRHFTKKDQILYTALINVSIGAELEKELNEDYLLSREMDPQKKEVLFYRNMYLSEDPTMENHEMAYASRIKLLAVINSKRLDFVLMNREAYDILSASDYLLDLNVLSGADERLFQELKPLLSENTVIIEDNAIEYNLNEAEKYEALTKEVQNGIDISGIPAIVKAGLSGAVYLGIIANTPRLTECSQYLRYILSPDTAGA